MVGSAVQRPLERSPELSKPILARHCWNIIDCYFQPNYCVCYLIELLGSGRYLPFYCLVAHCIDGVAINHQRAAKMQLQGSLRPLILPNNIRSILVCSKPSLWGLLPLFEFQDFGHQYLDICFYRLPVERHNFGSKCSVSGKKWVHSRVLLYVQLFCWKYS